MGQCGGPQQAGNHPIPGLQTWRAAPLGSRRQVWAGVARPVGTCPRRPQFFFFLLIYPATPLRRAARHSRFHRSFLFSDPRIFYGQKKKMPHAPQIPSLVSHIFCKIRWQKRGLGEIFLIFAQGQEVTSPPLPPPRASDCEFDLVAPRSPFLSLPVIYPVPPPRASTRHSRFRRSFLIPGAPDPNAPWSRFYNNS